MQARDINTAVRYRPPAFSVLGVHCGRTKYAFCKRSARKGWGTSRMLRAGFRDSTTLALVWTPSSLFSQWRHYFTVWMKALQICSASWTLLYVSLPCSIFRHRQRVDEHKSRAKHPPGPTGAVPGRATSDVRLRNGKVSERL